MRHIFALLFIASAAFTEQPTSGIFIIKKPSKKDPCEQQLKMLIGSKRVCILKEPIVKIDELEYVTDILYDQLIRCNYIDLGLSAASVNTLNQTNTLLPNSEFALVVNDDVICIFKIDGGIKTRYLRIGQDLDIKGLMIVHDALGQVRF